jgi:hypothetical protein
MGGIAKTHNERFAELQEAYLQTRDQKHLNEMYRLCVDIATNYIRKYARKRGLHLDIPELSHDSALYAIEQYLKKPGFRINRISAYMHFGCVKNLCRNKEREQREVSYDAYLLNEQAAYAVEESYERGEPEPVEGFKMRVCRHEPVIIKQWLLFEDAATRKEYEELLV